MSWELEALLVSLQSQSTYTAQPRAVELISRAGLKISQYDHRGGGENKAEATQTSEEGEGLELHDWKFFSLKDEGRMIVDFLGIRL